MTKNIEKLDRKLWFDFFEKIISMSYLYITEFLYQNYDECKKLKFFFFIPWRTLNYTLELFLPLFRKISDELLWPL